MLNLLLVAFLAFLCFSMTSLFSFLSFIAFPCFFVVAPAFPALCSWLAFPLFFTARHISCFLCFPASCPFVACCFPVLIDCFCFLWPLSPLFFISCSILAFLACYTFPNPEKDNPSASSYEPNSFIRYSLLDYGALVSRHFCSPCGRSFVLALWSGWSDLFARRPYTTTRVCQVRHHQLTPFFRVWSAPTRARVVK